MSEEQQPYKFESEDMRAMARVIAAVGAELSGELKETRQSIEQNTKALEELRNIRKPLDRNAKAAEELQKSVSRISHSGGQIYEALRVINQNMGVYMQHVTREDDDAQ